MDFSAPRSKRDADLLYEAKYGTRGEDGKMSREQYGALRRKIGGTAKVRATCHATGYINGHLECALLA